jgi:hypothetical protein
MPDMDDLLILAEIDEDDVIEAEAWLEDVAPEIAAKIGNDK